MQQLKKPTTKQNPTPITGFVGGTPTPAPVPASAAALHQYMSMVNGDVDPDTPKDSNDISKEQDAEIAALQAAAKAYCQHQQMIAASAASQSSDQPSTGQTDQQKKEKEKDAGSSSSSSNPLSTLTPEQQQYYQKYYQDYYENYYKNQLQQAANSQPIAATPVRYNTATAAAAVGTITHPQQSYSHHQQQQRQHQYPNPNQRHSNLRHLPQPPPPPHKPPVSSEDMSMLIKLRDQHDKFETMYQNWVGQFETWKKSNATHPQAKEITGEWEQWQQKLLKRRNEIQQLIMQCVSRIERLNPAAVVASQPEVTGVQQLLTQPSIAHLIKKKDEEDQSSNGKEKQEESKDDDDCQVIEVEKKEKDQPEVVTIAGDETQPATATEAPAPAPGHRLTTITVVPEEGEIIEPAPKPGPSKSPAKYVLSDDEYGEDPPESQSVSQKQAKEDQEERELEQARAEAKLKQESFFNQFIGKMNDIIARNASKSDIAKCSGFYHNRLPPLTPSKKPVPQIPPSPAYQIKFAKKTGSRLNDPSDSSGARNKSPPPDHVPPDSATILGPAIPKPRIVCPVCNMQGHLGKECSKNACFSCGEQGHLIRNCPNRSTARSQRNQNQGNNPGDAPMESSSSSNPIPMSRRRRKVYSESQQDLFPEAPKKVAPAEGDVPAIGKYGSKLLNPQSQYLIHNFEEDFYNIPDEPEYRIVTDEATQEEIRRKQQHQQQLQQQQAEEERRYEEELDRHQQEIEMEYASAQRSEYEKEVQRRRDQMSEISRLRRQELDPDRIGDQFLEKLRARNRLIDAEEQQRLEQESEYQRIMLHPNRYTIHRAVKECDRPVIVVLRGLIGSGKSKAAKCIKEEVQELDEDINCRILSLDDYFMDPVESKVVEQGKMVTRKTIKYRYDATKEDEYKDMMYEKLEKTLSKGDHEFIIIDACNNKERDLDAIFNVVQQQELDQDHNSGTILICEMEEWNEASCFKHGTHERSLQDIHRMKRDWFDTPSHMNALDWSFKTSKAQQLNLTSKDLEYKPINPELKRVLDHVERNNQKRFRTQDGPHRRYYVNPK